MGDWNGEGPKEPREGEPLWEDTELFEEPPLPGQGGGGTFAPSPGAGVWDQELPPVSTPPEPAPAAGLPEPRIVEPRARRPRPAPSRDAGRPVWVYVVGGLAIGLLLGAGLLIWQRLAMLSDQRVLERRLTSLEESATQSAEQVTTLEGSLASAEATVAALTAENTRLTSELATSQAALAAAQAQIAEAAKTLTITERSVSPTTVEKEKPLTLEVKVKGKADKVTMKIVGVSPVSFSKYYTLSKVSTSGGIETWRKSVTAPSLVGTYRYYATATIGTKSFDMPGVSAWSFEVKAGP